MMIYLYFIYFTEYQVFARNFWSLKPHKESSLV